MDNIRYGIATFSGSDGKIHVETLEWAENDFAAAVEAVKSKGNNFCGLFYYWDFPEDNRPRVLESTVEATREQFEAEPAKYGVCLYRRAYDNRWMFE